MLERLSDGGIADDFDLSSFEKQFGRRIRPLPRPLRAYQHVKLAREQVFSFELASLVDQLGALDAIENNSVLARALSSVQLDVPVADTQPILVFSYEVKGAGLSCFISSFGGQVSYDNPCRWVVWSHSPFLMHAKAAVLLFSERRCGPSARQMACAATMQYQRLEWPKLRLAAP